jgi:hypothetical protein
MKHPFYSLLNFRAIAQVQNPGPDWIDNLKQVFGKKNFIFDRSGEALPVTINIHARAYITSDVLHLTKIYLLRNYN